jgi:hypothetical protein
VRRFGVEYCDEGGTLFDSEGKPIHHTWSVVDRKHRDADGHPQIVHTALTRREARQVVDEMTAKAATEGID